MLKLKRSKHLKGQLGLPVSDVFAYSCPLSDVFVYSRPLSDVFTYSCHVSDVFAYSCPLSDICAFGQLGSSPKLSAKGAKRDIENTPKLAWRPSLGFAGRRLALA